MRLNSFTGAVFSLGLCLINFAWSDAANTTNTTNMTNMTNTTGASNISLNSSSASNSNILIAQESPEIKLQNVISALQKEINSNQTQLANNSQLLNQLVINHLLPIIYVNKMAAMTLGPKWRTATEEQRKEFVQQFSLLLTRTYSSALLQMGAYKITIFPLRGDVWKTSNYVAIAGQLAPSGGGASSSMTYYMEKDNGVWEIYDFALEGVSFVKNFRAQFEQYPDLQSLLARLEAMNAAVASATTQSGSSPTGSQ